MSTNDKYATIGWIIIIIAGVAFAIYGNMNKTTTAATPAATIAAANDCIRRLHDAALAFKNATAAIKTNPDTVLDELQGVRDELSQIRDCNPKFVEEATTTLTSLIGTIKRPVNTYFDRLERLERMREQHESAMQDQLLWDREQRCKDRRTGHPIIDCW